MYIVIETSPNSKKQTEYHIINEIQMKQFLIDKNCDETLSYEDFTKKAFSEDLQATLNETHENKQYEVVHVWLH